MINNLIIILLHFWENWVAVPVKDEQPQEQCYPPNQVSVVYLSTYRDATARVLYEFVLKGSRELPLLFNFQLLRLRAL